MKLPLTLVALRRQIQAGMLNVGDALRMQAGAMASDPWHCVVQASKPVTAAPDQTLPLAGVGLAHKDIFVTPDRRPVCGARVAPDFDASISPLVGRLATAGGVTLGSLSMAEFAAGITGENPNLPLPINPLGTRYAVGGSSSGSAVAVAAGLCYGSLGTDTAGSLRIPAATCGIFTLKPTQNVLELQGCFPLAPSLDTAGILARSALDAAVLFAAAMAPERRADILPAMDTVLDSLGGVAEAIHLPDRPWRIATVTDHPQARFSANAQVREAVLGVAQEFSHGPTRHHRQLDALQDMQRCASTILHVEAAGTHYGRLQAQDPGLSAITRAVVLPGAAIPAVWLEAAQRGRGALRQQFVEHYLSDADILLTPILPLGLPDWDQVRTGSPRFAPAALLAMFSWASFVNYLGLPAVVFPIAHDAQGAPVCVQAIGRPRSEEALLAFAYHLEQRLFGCNGFVKRVPLPHFHCPDS